MTTTVPLLKIVVAGDGNVGKTSLIRQYCEGRFEQSRVATIGVDFQTGHGVRFGGIAVEQVAAGLIGVGVVCAFVHGDEAAENGAAGVVESVLVEQITGGVRSFVVLQRALVHDLFTKWKRNA